jgi:protein gp37
MTTTAIEWAQSVWNPVVGCSIKSAGCTNCYAMAMAARVEACDVNGKSPHYAALTRKSGGRTVWAGKVNSAPDHVWLAPLKRRTPTLYFVNSMGDLFHEDVPDAWIDRAFAVMALCPQHKFIVLTKRADRMREYCHGRFSGAAPRMIFHIFAAMDGISKAKWPDQPFPLPNVALGVSVEDQPTADERIPDLLATPAAIRLISAEPLLSSVDLTAIQAERFVPADHEIDWKFSALETGSYYWFRGDDYFEGGDGPEREHAIDWVIAGGESGKGSRPCHPDWARSLRDQCAAAGVPFFWKQWGDWLPSDADDHPVYRARHCFENGQHFYRIGKKKAGALLDGQLHRAAPDGWSA